MAPPRRQTDDTEDDYRKLRGGGTLNGHTKWVVGVMGTLLITALVALAARDRNGIDREQAAQNAQISTIASSVSSLLATQAAARATSDAQWAEVNRRLQGIEDNVKDIKRKQ